MNKDMKSKLTLIWVIFLNNRKETKMFFFVVFFCEMTGNAFDDRGQLTWQQS